MSEHHINGRGGLLSNTANCETVLPVFLVFFEQFPTSLRRRSGGSKISAHDLRSGLIDQTLVGFVPLKHFLQWNNIKSLLVVWSFKVVLRSSVRKKEMYESDYLPILQPIIKDMVISTNQVDTTIRYHLWTRFAEMMFRSILLLACSRLNVQRRNLQRCAFLTWSWNWRTRPLVSRIA